MFPFTAAPAAPRAPKAALLTGAPGLRDGVDRLVAFLVKTLQTMAGESTAVEGLVSGMAAMQIRDVVTAHRPETVAATIACAGLPCTLLVTLDPVLVHTLVELLTGGDGREPPPEPARPVTAIDAQFTQILAALMASGVEKEWAGNGFGAAKAQRQDGALSAEVCGPRVALVGVITVTLSLFGQRGTALLVLPPAALDAFPQGAPSPEPVPPPDPEWRVGLQRELGLAPIRVEAFLQAERLALGAIAKLAVGDVVELAPMARSRAALVCDGRTFYLGELGLDGESFCVRVGEAVVQPPAKESPIGGPRSRGRSIPVKADA